MYDAVHDVRRVAVCGGVRRLEATALVDGYVDEHRAGLHQAEHVAGDEVWRLVAGDEDGADNQVYGGQFLADVVFRGVKGLHVLGQHFTEVAQAGQVDVRNHYLGTHAGSHLCGVASHDASAQYQYAGWTYARHASQQFALATLRLLKETGTFLYGHTAGHFTHGDEQGQRAVRQLDGFVGDTDTSAFYHGFGQGTVGGKVEVSEHHLSVADEFVLGGDGFLDLDNHLSGGIDFFDGGQHSCTCIHVVFIGKSTVGACRLLHVYGVSMFDEFGHSGRRHADTILIIFYFFRYTNNHNVKC